MSRKSLRRETFATELIFAIVILVLAAALVATALLSRRRIGKTEEAPTESDANVFKDCYDLCKHSPKLASDGCATMCAYGWP